MSWIQKQCNHWNQGIDQILNIHLSTPSPNANLKFRYESFDLPEPDVPTPKKYGIMGWLFKTRKEKIDLENRESQQQFQRHLENWNEEKRKFNRKHEKRKVLFETGRLEDTNSMQDFLEEHLNHVCWPRETNLSFQVEGDGEAVSIDVDLPEIEDLPTEQASVAARGLKINIKTRSDTQRRKEYMAHIHGIVFRIIGETFFALPKANSLLISAYSQRPDKSTGKVTDEYLISVRVNRDVWSQIDFSNLSELDLPLCFEKFDLTRKMTKLGVFKAIDPFEVR